ncbi:MAG: cytochrome P450 [Thermoleophilia bacterium]
MIDYNTLSEDFRRDRFSFFRELRDTAPVQFDEQSSTFILSRYDDVQAAARDWETYSSVGPEGTPQAPRLNDLDPPDHTVLRDKVSLALTAERMLGMEDALRDDARALLQELVPGGTSDLMADCFRPCLTRVVGRMLGLSDEQAAECLAISDLFVRGIPGEPVATPTAQERLQALFIPLIMARRQSPGDDLISALASVGSDGGDALSDVEILLFVLGVFLPSLGNNACAVATAVELLGAHPAQRDALVADPSLIPQAFEEAIRFDSTTHDSPRTLTRDVTLHGVTMPAGARVLMVWASANRDERTIDNPDQFDVHRERSQGLSFGFGVHDCIGAMLVRVEARVLLEELLAIAPEYTVVDVGPRIRSTWIWGHESLTVSFA